MFGFMDRENQAVNQWDETVNQTNPSIPTGLK